MTMFEVSDHRREPSDREIYAGCVPFAPLDERLVMDYVFRESSSCIAALLTDR